MAVIHLGPPERYKGNTTLRGKEKVGQVSFKYIPMLTTFSLTYLGRAIEARLQTAVSVGLVYSIISVHKLEDLIVPRFCWLLFLLQESYNNKQIKVE